MKKNLILLCIALVIGFTIFEVTMRQAYSLEFSLEREYTISNYGVFVKVPFTHFLYKHPGEEFSQYVDINSKGLRDYEYSYQKQTEIYRIAMIGDSMTEGYQVELNQSIPKLVEQTLQKKGKHEVINFGHGGFGFLPLAVLIEEEAMKYHPDMIILNYFVGNDFTKLRLGAYKKFPEEFWDPEKHEVLKKDVYSRSLKFEMTSFLRRYVASYYAFKRLFVFQKREGIAPGKEHEIYEKVYSEEINNNLATTAHIFSFLKQLLDENNITFVVVLIPVKEQVTQTIPKEKYDLLKPQQSLKDILGPLNITYLDLYPALRKAQQINNTYWDIDGHLNVYGYRMAAEAIADFLANDNLPS